MLSYTLSNLFSTLFVLATPLQWSLISSCPKEGGAHWTLLSLLLTCRHCLWTYTCLSNLTPPTTWAKAQTWCGEKGILSFLVLCPINIQDACKRILMWNCLIAWYGVFWALCSHGTAAAPTHPGAQSHTDVGTCTKHCWHACLSAAVFSNCSWQNNEFQCIIFLILQNTWKHMPTSNLDGTNSALCWRYKMIQLLYIHGHSVKGI